MNSSTQSDNSSKNNTASVSLVLSAISDHAKIPKTHKLTVYADMMKVQTTTQTTPMEPKSGGTRGHVTTFSAKSRKRMIEALAQKRKLGTAVFVTLTYPDEVWFHRNMNGRDCELHRRNFIKRLMRLYPDMPGIWRREWETRKSGDNLGKVAPHIHIVLDAAQPDLATLTEDINDAWHDVLTNSRRDLPKKPRVDVQIARSRRHAYYYLSKYVAKLTSDDDDDENVSAIVAYLKDQGGNVGRHWGTFGAWDISPGHTVDLTTEEAVILRRLIANWMRSRGSRYGKRLKKLSPHTGFSSFGLGDERIDARSAPDTIMRLIEHARSLARENAMHDARSP